MRILALYHMICWWDQTLQQQGQANVRGWRCFPLLQPALCLHSFPFREGVKCLQRDFLATLNWHILSKPSYESKFFANSEKQNLNVFGEYC